MVNKVYNIIIYSHIVLSRIDNLFIEINYGGSIDDAFKPGNNIIPDHVIEYLDEKANKYLGISYHDIDHAMLFEVMYGTIIVNSPSELVQVFSDLWAKIHDRQYMFIENDILFPNVKKYDARGVDYKIMGDIKEYLEVYDVSGKGELDAIVRDLQLKIVLGE